MRRTGHTSTLDRFVPFVVCFQISSYPFKVAPSGMQRRIPPETKGGYQYATVIEEMMGSIAQKIAAQPNWQEVLRTRYNKITSMVENFAGACDTKFWERKPEADSRDRLRVLWRHRDLYRAMKEGPESAEACHVNRETLSELALDYLKQDARSGEFERLLV